MGSKCFNNYLDSNQVYLLSVCVALSKFFNLSVPQFYNHTLSGRFYMEVTTAPLTCSTWRLTTQQMLPLAVLGAVWMLPKTDQASFLERAADWHEADSKEAS